MGAILGVVVGRSDIREPRTDGAGRCSAPGGRPIRLAGRSTSRRAQARPRRGAAPGSSGGAGRRCERRGASLQVLHRLVQPVQPVPHTSAAHSETHPHTARTTAQNGRLPARGGGRLRVHRARRAGGLRPHRGGAGERARQRDAGAAGGLRERAERRAGGEPRSARHRGDPRRRDDDARGGGVRRARGPRRSAPSLPAGGRKRPMAPPAACRPVGRSGSDGALNRPGAQSRQGC